VQNTQCSSAGEVGAQTFLLNSAFAPGNITTVGTKHQPKGYDQWSVFYNEYLVKRATITAVVNPLGSTSITSGYLALTLSDVNPSFTLTNDILEDPKTVFKPFAGLGAEPCVVTQKWDLSREVLGGADFRSAISGQYGALTTASPVDLWYCQVSICSDAVGGTVSVTNVLIELDLDILFLSRRNIPQS
jgi:hypothetical protein